MNTIRRNERGQIIYMARSNCAAEAASHYTNTPHQHRGAITVDDLPGFDPLQSNIASNRRLFPNT